MYDQAQVFDRAADLHRKGNLAAAETLYLQLLEARPDHFDALHLLGVVCLDRARSADAVEYLTRAVHERPDDGQVHYHLGTALLEQKRYEQAEVALRRAVGLRRGDHSALTNLGNALAGSGRHAEAIACYDQVLAAEGETSGGDREPRRWAAATLVRMATLIERSPREIAALSEGVRR